jgi:acyl-CoA reductase-like NAD-dependent aldehyde dehydrogenase
MGARVALGGKAVGGPDGKGYFYAPTLLTQVTDETPVF